MGRRGRHKNPIRKVHEEEWDPSSIEQQERMLSSDPEELEEPCPLETENSVTIPVPPPEKVFREGHLWELWGGFLFIAVGFFYGLHLYSLVRFSFWWPRGVTLALAYVFITPLEGIVYWRVWKRSFGRCFTASAWMNGVMALVALPFTFWRLGPPIPLATLAIYGISFLAHVFIEGLLAQYYLFRGLPFRQILRGVVVANAASFMATSLFFSVLVGIQIFYPAFKKGI